VNVDSIQSCLSRHADAAGDVGSGDWLLSKLQTELKCGTNCGSCVPELKKIIRQSPVAA
jgi:assimilatory nitrate reductase catalytic subunit